MQDLVVGREYIATLYNNYYQGESLHIRYLGGSTEPGGIINIEIVTQTEWPSIDFDDDGVWRAGERVSLHPDNYTFEEYHVSLENK